VAIVASIPYDRAAVGDSDRQVDADVVVAGAGGAGVTAALAAAERGLSVVLLEGSETFREDSNTAMSTSMVPAAGTRQQREAGVEDTAELFLEDIQLKTAGTVDPTVARTLVDVAPVLIDWLAEAWGIDLELVTDFNYPGHSRHRCHSVPDRAGSTLLRLLLGAVAQRDEIALVCPARLDGIVADVDGSVEVAALMRPDGTREDVRTRSVILATNGFGASPELVREHCPEIVDGLYFGGEGSNGDALRFGAGLDADTACLDAYQGHGSVAYPHGVLLTWATVVHGAFLVNADGKRFADESPGYSELATPVLAQPENAAWMVYDARIDELCRPFADYQRCLEAGAVHEAKDVAALAEVIGTSAEVVASTLVGARSCALGEADDPLGRTDWAAPLEPPYRAVHVTGALFHTQGGLGIDSEARVQRGGSPIDGLYAAGGAAVGISGHGASGYLAGNGLLAALGLGLVAGRAACCR